MKGSSYFCHYTEHWYCSKCMSPERRIIPWNVIDNWDFKQYPISRDGQKELDDYYKLRIIKIESKNCVANKNRILYDALVKIY